MKKFISLKLSAQICADFVCEDILLGPVNDTMVEK
jgi:hypothetical protein